MKSSGSPSSCFPTYHPSVESEYIARPARDYLWNQLLELPYFRALLRAIEARFYERLPVREPVLDLGSGDGSFAAHAFTRPLTAGIDPWWGPMLEARRRAAHHVLALAAGAALPFADATFQTVVSNSVLEHIPDLDPVVAEAFRVLRPGGYLLFCAPSEHFTDWLLGASVLGDLYRRWFNRIARHHHCDSPTVWRARLAQAGFETEAIWYYFSPRALRTLELGHYLGLPNLISKKLFDKWVLFPSRHNPLLRLLDAALRPIYDEPLPAVGACLFGVARKP
ncbi:MAG: methyltransferase domain-containing protein [Anaerolineae bacterium]|nr:methyltransferase domain-containing protein [Thermoflexales bacterium]MDW8408122.1 methyltransferase domain-containing protein [Anaerolineae bacterium]